MAAGRSVGRVVVLHEVVFMSLSQVAMAIICGCATLHLFCNTSGGHDD